MTSTDTIIGWWTGGEFPRLGYALDLIEQAQAALTRAAFIGGPVPCRKTYNGMLDWTAHELEEYIASLGVRKVATYPSTPSDKYGATHFVKHDSAVVVDYEEEITSITFVSTDYDLNEALTDICVGKLKPRVSAGKVYTLKSGDDGLDLVSMGSAAFPLERENYELDVLMELDHVVEELQTKDPCGRLVVLNGQPGTGKTYLMRGLLALVPNSLFITIPPNLISRFSNPEFIPTLLELKRDSTSKTGSTILLIEDADEILVPRHQTDMDSISSCLNLSDGLMGHLFDLRIIATTNATKANMDPALLRPGRLCRRIDVGVLGHKRAADVYTRLTGKVLPEHDKYYTLADLYVMARDNGWTPVKEAGKMGFTTENYNNYPKALRPCRR